MRIVVATNNSGKLNELRALLGGGVEFLTLSDVGLSAPEETGTTFEENALLKARAARQHGDAAIADDSGLEVEALDGAPGVYSARYSGPGATDHANTEKLLQVMESISRGHRAARFVSVVAFVTTDGRELTARGTVHGLIAEKPSGSNGFGYDPIFEIDDAGAEHYRGLTMAELTTEEKNRISHRGRAFRELRSKLIAAGFLSEESTTPNRQGR